ncbi:DUF2726 domain-containing protein [Paenibacillus sp. GCM10023248]|uniref:DUF2726 domain-containing protein n=1 Tax=unclassified Paenibacillus TaxID=185978 RepID=UPI002379DAF5|nr:DUF2726 domain-containing protein [Paenibacillus sp. MAHUQ-63]MDD9267863.1 DUF2726 domain-containing protein [Paenibacillus sp. MAHUQ-63]
MPRKKTQQELEQQVLEITKGEFKVNGEYKNNYTKIPFTHTICGKDIEVSPNYFLSKEERRECFHCEGYGLKKTTESFRIELKEKRGLEYAVIGEYVDANTKIKARHNVCGYEWDTMPYTLFIIKSCPKCSSTYKRTEEDFKKELKEMHGDDYELISDYTNTQENVTLKHKCGFEWSVKPTQLLNRGTQCYNCFGSVKLTHEQFVQRIEEKYGHYFSVLGTYEHSQERILMKHNECGYEWRVMPSKLLYRDSTRPKCYGKQKKTHEAFLEVVSNVLGDDYIVLSEYEGMSRTVLMKHISCGYEWDYHCNSIHVPNKCPNCSKNKKKTHKEFIEIVEEIHGEEYVLLEEYISMNKKIKVMHSTCREKWNVTPRHLLDRNCPTCSMENKRQKLLISHDDYVAKLFSVWGNEFETLSVYKISRENMQFRHNKCGFEFWTRPYNLLIGQGCLQCKESRGERMIGNMLRALTDSSENTFDIQKRLNDCRDKYPLPFDFVVYNQSEEIICLIEYDGRQHFEPVEAWGGKEDFKEVQRRDKIKTEYCIGKSIELIRIPYYLSEEDVYRILNSRIN